MVNEPEETSGRYKEVASRVREWLEIHKGEHFDLDLISRQLNLGTAEARKYAAIELSRKVQQGILEKVSNRYIYIDSSYKVIDWLNASVESFDVKFPYGIEDQTKFGFDGSALISPGDIIVIAGQSNAGKTLFCLNLLWENMDNYPCTLMGNEYAPGKFKRRVFRMKWRSPVNVDGQPKFELIERFNRWQDIIRPNNINIIDWINITDNFYQIGGIIEAIKGKLERGIAVISLQKSGENPHGRGGTFSVDMTSLYLSMDFNRLTVIKSKEWERYNPNRKTYGFEIVNQGTQFQNIRAIKKCYRCKGNGFNNQGKCDECGGTGWIDDPKDDSCEMITQEYKEAQDE
uniref:Uncharacterized protein n=1 Tax=viral metagenome TaxID=1070528 RepID=A0A6M3KZT2_9ZZZZ